MEKNRLTPAWAGTLGGGGRIDLQYVIANIVQVCWLLQRVLLMLHLLRHFVFQDTAHKLCSIVLMSGKLVLFLCGFSLHHIVIVDIVQISWTLQPVLLLMHLLRHFIIQDTVHKVCSIVLMSEKLVWFLCGFLWHHIVIVPASVSNQGWNQDPKTWF